MPTPGDVFLSKDVVGDLSEVRVLRERDHNKRTTETTMQTSYVTDPADPSQVMADATNRPVTVDRWLQCRPFQSDILRRPGPGGKQISYLSGESVTRTLNHLFGFRGWNLSILKTEQVVCTQQDQAGKSSMGQQQANTSRWQVAYTAHVRITHVLSGSFREDVGAGESIDKQLATAVQHALKSSITDAMKRAARHFGEKLGNSLYQSSFRYNDAPRTVEQALQHGDKERNKVFHNTICMPGSSPVSVKSTQSLASSDIAPTPAPGGIPQPQPVVVDNQHAEKRRLSAPNPINGLCICHVTPQVTPGGNSCTSSEALENLFDPQSDEHWAQHMPPPPSRGGYKRPSESTPLNSVVKKPHLNPYNQS